MSSMLIFIIIVLIGAATFAFRFSFIALQERLRTPSWFQRMLRYVPVAVLPALIAPQLLYLNQQFSLSLTNLRLLAGIVAIGIALRTKNAVFTIGLGLVTLWILQWLM